MADNITTGTTGVTVLADEITDATLGTGIAQFVKVMGGTLGSSEKWIIDTHGSGQMTIVDSSGVAITFNGNGQQTAANSAPVVQASNTSFAYSASGTFYSTTSGSTYAANDVYGSTASGGTTNVSAVFSFGAPSAGRIMITSATLEIDTGTSEATAFKLRLYNATPPSNTADNGAWDLASGDRASYLGSINFGTPTDEGSTLYSEIDSLNKQIKLSGTAVYGYLTNVSSSTAMTTVDHIVTLHAVSV